MKRASGLIALAALLTACGANEVAPPDPSSTDGAVGDAATPPVSDAAPLGDGASSDGSTPIPPPPTDAGSRCPGSETLCGTHCIDTSIDPFNCGACGHACTGGGECASGTCVMPCVRPNSLCGTTCLNLTNDPNHCGSCEVHCAAGEICGDGVCLTPDERTYTLVRDNNVDWIDACTAPGHTNVLANTDDGVASLTMPFAFRYWDLDLPAGAPLSVCSNGWLATRSYTSPALNGTIPSMTGPLSVIAPYWYDLVTRSTGVCVATVGPVGSRRFAIEWSDVRYFSAGAADANLTFEIVINEADGSVDLLYPIMSGAMTATVGIDDARGAQGVSVCESSATCDVTTNTALHFRPNG